MKTLAPAESRELLKVERLFMDLSDNERNVRLLAKRVSSEEDAKDLDRLNEMIIQGEEQRIHIVDYLRGEGAKDDISAWRESIRECRDKANSA